MNVPKFHEIMAVMDSWISLNLHVHGSTAEAYGASACPGEYDRTAHSIVLRAFAAMWF